MRLCNGYVAPFRRLNSINIQQKFPSEENHKAASIIRQFQYLLMADNNALYEICVYDESPASNVATNFDQISNQIHFLMRN